MNFCFPDLNSFIGMDDMRKFNSMARALFAEFVGTALIVLVGCGSCKAEQASHVQIGLAFGLTVGLAVTCFAGISGGHLNPAVTCALLVTGKCPLLRSVLYVVVQCVGAIAGAGLLRAVSANKQELCPTLVNGQLTPVQGFGVEVLITFFLVLTVFAVTDESRFDVQNANVGFAVGLVITACHMFAISYTGSSMNTARSFGPAVVMNKWTHHWVYWVGPIFGGVLAGLVYVHVLFVPHTDGPPIPREKFHHLLRALDRDFKEVVVDKTTVF